MINASGTSPSKYISGIKSILSKVEGKKAKAEAKEEKVNLEDYVGFYNQQPWWSEEYVGVLNGKLVQMSLPIDNPGSSLSFLKHIEGDTFRRIRKDKKLGEAIIFERDENGKVVKYSQHGNYSTKIEH